MTSKKTEEAVVSQPSNDPKYNELVTKACTLVKTTNDRFVEFYWELGAFIKEATGGAKTGPRSVPEFLKHMQQVAPGRITLGEESLYNALKVRNSLTLAQLKLAKESGISLRNLVDMCNKNTTPEMRENTLKRIAAGEVQPSDAGDDVRRQAAAEKEKGGGAAPAGGVDKRSSTIKVMRFPALLQTVTEKVLGYAEALSVLCGEATTDEEIDKIQTAVRLADDYMDNLNTTFQAELAKGRKIMDKTITQLSRAERNGKAVEKSAAKPAARPKGK